MCSFTPTPNLVRFPRQTLQLSCSGIAAYLPGANAHRARMRSLPRKRFFLSFFPRETIPISPRHLKRHFMEFIKFSCRFLAGGGIQTASAAADRLRTPDSYSALLRNFAPPIRPPLKSFCRAVLFRHDHDHSSSLLLLQDTGSFINHYITGTDFDQTVLWKGMTLEVFSCSPFQF